MHADDLDGGLTLLLPGWLLVFLVPLMLLLRLLLLLLLLFLLQVFCVQLLRMLQRCLHDYRKRRVWQCRGRDTQAPLELLEMMGVQSLVYTAGTQSKLRAGWLKQQHRSTASTSDGHADTTTRKQHMHAVRHMPRAAAKHLPKVFRWGGRPSDNQRVWGLPHRMTVGGGCRVATVKPLRTRN